MLRLNAVDFTFGFLCGMLKRVERELRPAQIRCSDFPITSERIREASLVVLHRASLLAHEDGSGQSPARA